MAYVRIVWELDQLRPPTVPPKNARIAGRMLALAAALEGRSRTDAARIGGMDRQTLRDWVHRYNEHDLDGLRDDHQGAPPRLTEGQQAALRALVYQKPPPDSGLAEWRLCDLVSLVEERFGVRYTLSGMWRVLEGLGLSKMTARPRHPQADPKSIDAFKKTPEKA